METCSLSVRMCVYLKPGAMSCIRMLLSGKSSFNSSRHKCNGRVSIDTFVCEVSPVEQPAPRRDSTQCSVNYKKGAHVFLFIWAMTEYFTYHVKITGKPGSSNYIFYTFFSVMSEDKTVPIVTYTIVWGNSGTVSKCLHIFTSFQILKVTVHRQPLMTSHPVCLCHINVPLYTVFSHLNPSTSLPLTQTSCFSQIEISWSRFAS